MRSSIGNFIAVDRTVPVTFRDGDFVHKRTVNAVIDEAGNYDRAATRLRVADVAAGVAAKQARGVFRATAPSPEPANEGNPE